MAKYDLPDGQVLTVPDDLAPDKRDRLAAAVQRD
jgi:hypothetical protein